MKYKFLLPPFPLSKAQNCSILLVKKENIHWIREDLKIDIDTPTVYDSRIRYRQKLTPCSITSSEFGLKVSFKEVQRGITPGQFISWYKNDELIGSGIIN